jgi:hypothetical protein
MAMIEGAPILIVGADFGVHSRRVKALAEYLVLTALTRDI